MEQLSAESWAFLYLVWKYKMFSSNIYSGDKFLHPSLKYFSLSGMGDSKIILSLDALLEGLLGSRKAVILMVMVYYRGRIKVLVKVHGRSPREARQQVPGVPSQWSCPTTCLILLAMMSQHVWSVANQRSSHGALVSRVLIWGRHILVGVEYLHDWP